MYYTALLTGQSAKTDVVYHPADWATHRDIIIMLFSRNTGNCAQDNFTFGSEHCFLDAQHENYS